VPPGANEEDPYEFVSQTVYKCSNCAASSKWRRPWRWFGRVDSPLDEKIVICSDECQSIYEEEHGKLTEQDPLVVKASLIPTAFNVICPACERESEVPDWKESGAGYFEFDASTINGPFVRCQCGALIEPQGVRTQPWVAECEEST